MISVVTLVTGDEFLAELENDYLDMDAREVLLLNPMQIVATSAGMYLRSPLIFSNENFLIVPTNKIVYSYHPSETVKEYYCISVEYNHERVAGVMNRQVQIALDDLKDVLEELKESEADPLNKILKDFSNRTSH